MVSIINNKWYFALVCMVWPLTKMLIHLSYGVQYLEYTVGGIQDVNHS